MMIDIEVYRPEVILALFALIVPGVGLLVRRYFKDVSVSKVCAAFALLGVFLAFFDA